MNENASVGPKLSTNVNKLERISSIAAGGLLIYNALTNKDKLMITKAGAGAFLLFRGLTGYCPMYEMMGTHKYPDPVKNVNIKIEMTVNKPRSVVYAFWRELSNLPLFMKHLGSVTKIDETRSHWKAKGPGGLGVISWDAEIVKEEYNKLIGWNSLPGATIENAGKVEFKDAGANATDIRVIITYRAPLGPVGEGIAKLLNPTFEKMIIEDVQGFKNYIETEVAPTA